MEKAPKHLVLSFSHLIKRGAPGVHFYTINQLEPTKLILDNLD